MNTTSFTGFICKTCGARRHLPEPPRRGAGMSDTLVSAAGGIMADGPCGDAAIDARRAAGLRIWAGKAEVLGHADMAARYRAKADLLEGPG